MTDEEFKQECNYFLERINAAPDDILDVWPILNASEPPIEFKKYHGVDSYDTIFLPASGSEQARFRDLIWRGTWESLADIDEAKCKKLKFLNSIKNLKQRYLVALKFMATYGPRSGYWSTNVTLPEESYIV